MWSDEKDKEVLYHRAIQESYRILGSESRDRIGWTREEIIAASGMEEAAFRETYLDFLEGKFFSVLVPLTPPVHGVFFVNLS